MKFDDILKIDATEVPAVEDLQGSIRDALESGEDPLPGVSLALLSAIAELQSARKSVETLEQRLESTQLYVLGLETRLLQSGLRFADPDESINPTGDTDGSE